MQVSGITAAETIAPIGTSIYNLVLSANTAKLVEIPSCSVAVLISCNADYWAKFGDSSVVAAIPTADITDGTGSLFAPAGKILGAETHISFISPVDCKLSLEWF